MSAYLLLESRDPFDSNDVGQYLELAEGLAKQGDTVTLFLVQNGVLAARRSTASKALTKLAQAGVTVLADDFSLKERGISNDRLAEGIKPAPLDTVVDQLAEGVKTLWH